MQTLPLFPDDDADNGDDISSESSPYSVLFLTNYIKTRLEDDAKLRNVWIEGEISNLSRPSSGHIYFTLKDAEAQLRCVMWRSDAERLQFDLKNNDQIITQGKIGIYEKGGQYQLYARKIQPVGAGDLNRQLQLLYAKLKAEGLFEDRLKQRLTYSADQDRYRHVSFNRRLPRCAECLAAAIPISPYHPQPHACAGR